MKRPKKTQIEIDQALEIYLPEAQWVIDQNALAVLLTEKPSGQFLSIRLDVLGRDPETTCVRAYNALREGGLLYLPESASHLFERKDPVNGSDYVVVVRQ